MHPVSFGQNGTGSTLCSARHKKESTEAYLIRLTLNFLNAWNDQLYDEILSAEFLAPAYQMQRGFGKVEVEGNPPVNIQGLVEHHQKLAADSPERHAHAVEASAVMDKYHLSGQIFVSVELTGHPPGVMYDGMIVSEWRWLHDKWLCVRQTCMRGLGMAGLDPCEMNE